MQGVDSPLYALEVVFSLICRYHILFETLVLLMAFAFILSKVNPEKAREEFQSASQRGEGGVKNLMDSMGLGMLADQVRTDISSQCSP